MASDDRTSVERIASKKTVEQLARAKSAMNSRIGDERGAYGRKVETAVENDHLDKLAFDFITRLHKMDAGKAARHFRNVMIYAEHLGVGAQVDLEDHINGKDKDDPVSSVAKPKDSFDQGKAGKIKQAITTAHPEKAIADFKTKLEGCKAPKAVNAALQKFVAGHQDLAEQAEKLAEGRVTSLASKGKASGDEFGLRH